MWWIQYLDGSSETRLVVRDKAEGQVGVTVKKEHEGELHKSQKK